MIPRRRALLTAALMVLLSGCAVVMPYAEREGARNAIRDRGQPVTAPARDDLGEMPGIFADLGKAAGVAATEIYLASEPSAHLNAASFGGGYFTVTTGVVQLSNLCLAWGLAAHELAHDRLRHSDKNVLATTAL